MNNTDAIEQAYRNGYEDGKRDAVKHGTWRESFSYGRWHYECPFCDNGYATKEKDETPPNYCGNCGAKMDGEIHDKISQDE